MSWLLFWKHHPDAHVLAPDPQHAEIRRAVDEVRRRQAAQRQWLEELEAEAELYLGTAHIEKEPTA